MAGRRIAFRDPTHTGIKIRLRSHLIKPGGRSDAEERHAFCLRVLPFWQDKGRPLGTIGKAIVLHRYG